MDSTEYNFNQYLNKIIKALTLFFKKNNNDLNKFKAVKLMFFADRYHLRKYGRLLSSDIYYAMKLGPVCSKTTNMTKMFGTSISENRYKYSTNGVYNSKVFSNSDKEAITFSLEHFNKFKYSDLVDITHDYPEWKQYSDFFMNPKNKGKRIKINIFDFFKNPIISNSKHLKYYLKGKDFFSMDKDLLKCSKIIFNQSLKTNELWN